MVNLRMLDKEDLKSYVEHLKDPAVTRYILLPYPFGTKEARDFYKSATEKLQMKLQITYTILDKNDNSVCGMIGLFNIDHINKRAKLRYWLARSDWDKGISSDAVSMILAVGFRKLKLNRIYTPVFHPNKASMEVLEKNGFLFEGVFRKTHFRRGRWLDEHWFSILKEDYAKMNRKKKG